MPVIYVPELTPSGAVPLSLGSLIEKVRDRIGDYTEEHEINLSGDGSRTKYRLRRRIEEGSLVVTVDGVPVDPQRVDYASGWVTLAEAPESGAAIRFSFRYNKYGRTQVTDAINRALPMLWPQFYVHASEDDLLTSGSELEYLLPTGCEVITHIRQYKDGRWVENLAWDLAETEAGEVIHFRRRPGSYQMRVEYVARPFGTLSSADDTLNDIGLPEYAENPIVVYAGYELLHGKIAADELAEARSLRSQKTTIDAVQAFLTTFLFVKQSVAMQPWEMTMPVSYG